MARELPFIFSASSPRRPGFLARLRLRDRLVIFLGLFLLVLMIVVSALGAQRDRNLLTQQMREEGLALARAYALSAENALILKGAGLPRVVGEAGQIPEIAFLVIVDPTRRVLAHTDPNHIGETVDDPAVRQALDTAIGAVDAGRTPVVTTVSAGGQDLLEVVVPLVILDQVRGALQIGLTTRLIQEAALTTSRSSFLIALAAFLLGVGFIVVFSHSITRPLEALSKAADRIRAGAWDVPVASPGPGEVGQLAEAMERMRREVSASFDRLRERTAEVDELRTYAEDILDGLQAGVITLDLGGRIRGLNQSTGRLLGLAEAGAGGLRPEEAFAPWPELLGAFRAAMADEGRSQELVLPGRAEAGPGRNRLLRLHANRLQDRRGAVIGDLVVLEDITFLRSMEHRMRDAEKMAAMGELSAGVAHEVRNPLGSIRNAAQFLEGKLEAGDPRARFARIIIEEVDRLNGLVSRLLQYTRSEKAGFEVHDLRTSVDQAVLLAELRVPSSRVPLHRVYQDGLPPVLADPRRIVQLLLNLLFNAYEAIPDRGTITVGLEASGPGVAVTVADTGVGMGPEVLARLGEPFFTTREAGTGLGLAIARQIVDEHRGSLDFRSTPGGGTLVRIEFPPCQEEPPHDPT